MSSGVSEWANEWAQQSAVAKRAVRSKRMSERWERTSRRESGSVLTFGFLVVYIHCAHSFSTNNNNFFFSFWQFFITLMAFATYSVHPSLPQNRLQLSFTLLLTAVTFKWVVNRCLPTISYLTSLVSSHLSIVTNNLQPHLSGKFTLISDSQQSPTSALW